MSLASETPPRDDLRLPTVLGAAAAFLLLAGLVAWAAVTPIAGAVPVEGQAIVRGEARKVQSLDGGIVAAVAVQNGDRVEAGDVLLRLDSTLLAANLDMALGRLAEALARRARLEAEQAGLAAPVFAYDPLPFALPATARQEEGQRQIFAARSELRRGRRDQLAERLAQYGGQIAGTTAQIAAKRDQLGFLERDLANVSRLSDQGLVRQSQLTDLQRGRAELLGQIAALEADLGRLGNAMRDAELETLLGERGFMEEVVTELGRATAEIGELTLEILTRREQLGRVEIRAPVSGLVHQFHATTPGGVVAPGATILEVVPLEEGIEFELRLEPRHVDQVWPGQEAGVVIAALNSRVTPTLEGRVVSVSPGLVTDPATGLRHFRVGLAVPPAEIARLGAVALVPGMPVEAYLRTGERTVINYLLEPLTGQLRRAFREE